jgi:purine nucleosidase
LCESKVPVFVGAEKPLKRKHVNAQWFHGRDGLGDHGYPAARRSAEKESAVDAIIRFAESFPGLEIVTLAPLTNIALALEKKPSIAANVKRCVVMGGAPCCEGNVTPAAEYNIWCDPEAAQMVTESGMAMELVGWHLCRGKAALSGSDIQHVLSLGTAAAKFAIECNSFAQQAYLKQTGEHGISLPDPVAMAVALDPSIVTSGSEHFMDIETGSELTRGMTVVDRLNVAGDERNRELWGKRRAAGHKTKIVWKIDNTRWKQMLYATLK